MEKSLFTKIDEEFICENCGKKVEKLGYTCRNHCPYCLTSKHVDINPGDRLEQCHGLLEPVGLEIDGKKGYVIIFKCKKCGQIRKNKAAKDDNMDLIIELSAKRTRSIWHSLGGIMRIRYKPWARPELEACKFYVDNPEDYKGKWKELFENKQNPIYLELGCGKGGFISKLAVQNPNINFVAIDMVDAMLGLAKRNIEREYEERNIPISNVIITRFDIERILMIMDASDKIDRIYINFCNPWPRGKHRKKRLTHVRQLEKYKQFLKPSGEIYFKTDDDNLFNDSLIYFEQAGLKILDKTYDLANTPGFWTNIETEHERMFMNEGIKIKAAKVIKE